MTAATAQDGGARIGPNAVLQLDAALTARLGPAAAERVFAAAGLAAFRRDPPDAMVSAAAVAALHQSLRRELGPEAMAVARDAGARTADYLLAHRIPTPAQKLLRWMPRSLAAQALLAAIRANAWTFAGDGRVTTRASAPCRILIDGNPIVVGESASAPVCHWHCAVFERLFRALVTPTARVVETACAAAGADACRFEIQFD